MALIVYLIWYYTRRRKNPELFHMKPKEPAHIIALRNLDQLREDKLMEGSLVKKYYSRLTEIIRIYISDQYGMQAMESTSGEIMEEFKSLNREDSNLNEMLEELLQLADLVLDNTDPFVVSTVNGKMTELLEALNRLEVSPRYASHVALDVVEIFSYVEYIEYLLPGSITLAIFACAVIGGGLLGLEAEGEPDVALEVAGSVRDPKIRGEYADYRARLAVQHDRLTHDRRVGPEAGAEHLGAQ